jgi:hypothetical protein
MSKPAAWSAALLAGTAGAAASRAGPPGVSAIRPQQRAPLVAPQQFPMNVSSFEAELASGLSWWLARAKDVGWLRGSSPAFSTGEGSISADAFAGCFDVRLVYGRTTVNSSVRGVRYVAARQSPLLALDYVRDPHGQRVALKRQVGMLDAPPALPMPLRLLHSRHPRGVSLAEYLAFTRAHDGVGFMCGAEGQVMWGVVNKDRSFAQEPTIVSADVDPATGRMVASGAAIAAVLRAIESARPPAESGGGITTDQPLEAAATMDFSLVPVVWYRFQPDTAAAFAAALDGPSQLSDTFAGLSRSLVSNPRALRVPELLARDMQHGHLAVFSPLKAG